MPKFDVMLHTQDDEPDDIYLNHCHTMERDVLPRKGEDISFLLEEDEETIIIGTVSRVYHDCHPNGIIYVSVCVDDVESMKYSEMRFLGQINE